MTLRWKTARFATSDWTNSKSGPPGRTAQCRAGLGWRTGRGAAREAKDVKGAYGAALVIDGRFGERWIAGGKELRITFARPERIDRVFFSSDRPRALGEQRFLTTFVGDYWLDVSLDGQQWTEVANSLDRRPATPQRKLARLLKAVTTDDDRAGFEAIDRQLAAVTKTIDRVSPLPVWWVGKRQPAPGPFHAFAGGNPQRPGETVAAASLSALDGRTSGYRLDEKSTEAERRRSVGPLAGLEGESLGAASAGQSRLALSFRLRTGRHAQRFRLHGRPADASRIARLSGRPIACWRLAAEAVAPTGHDLAGLSAVF